MRSCERRPNGERGPRAQIEKVIFVVKLYHSEKKKNANMDSPTSRINISLSGPNKYYVIYIGKL